MTKPLSGLRVLDMSRILAGPWCGQVLADLGAEVIKVERPGKGDDTRGWGPPFLKDQEGNETGESAYYLCANRAKHSITLDIAKPEGQAIARELAQHADIVLENYKVGDLKRYGLDYATLSQLNPRLVYCSITGFGQDGPFKDRAGYDFMVQGMGGLMSITGERDDLPGGGPQKAGVAIADLMTGMYASVAILAAIEERHRSGQGQYIDMALLDTQVAWLANQNSNYLIGGTPPVRMGNAHPNVVPYQTFATRDGSIILAIGNDGQFRRFCNAAGIADAADDARFASNALRIANREACIAAITPAMQQKTTAEWIAILEPLGVPCGPVHRLDEVFANPQIRHRQMQVNVPHPLCGTVPLVANPIKYSRTPLDYRTPPPLLGQHTGDILRDVLGKNDTEIEALRAAGII
ncbi:MAG: CoA transferase [Betaproteobacteria bacterium]|jgi:formyl-CoA transferase|nr:CoA transferase [Betaproteobacteria bacterium]MDH4293237.1 CoA transferase [Betaproteobacteria bacterium]MDH5342888.1 CoA transferase [Betaproteobacteria bacterium]